jgi:hypothetical protein
MVWKLHGERGRVQRRKRGTTSIFLGARRPFIISVRKHYIHTYEFQGSSWLEFVLHLMIMRTWTKTKKNAANEIDLHSSYRMTPADDSATISSHAALVIHTLPLRIPYLVKTAPRHPYEVRKRTESLTAESVPHLPGRESAHCNVLRSSYI